jgi:hypothetical protein
MSDIAELSAAMAKAFGDCHAEAAILYKMYFQPERSGRQHATRPLHDRLISRIVCAGSECWHWVGVRSDFGYGRMTYEGRTQAAHRLSYRAFVGEIPDGFSVLHRCDNPSCINPDHLWLGTYADNRRDCQDKGRWRLKNKKSGFAHHSTIVTPALLAEAQRMRSEGLSYKRVAAQLGVSTMTVWHAMNGRFE